MSLNKFFCAFHTTLTLRFKLKPNVIQDADNYAKAWTRVSVGANYFFEKQDVKVRTTYRMGSNVDGVDGKDMDELFVQFQYVF